AALSPGSPTAAISTAAAAAAAGDPKGNAHRPRDVCRGAVGGHMENEHMLPPPRSPSGLLHARPKNLVDENGAEGPQTEIVDLEGPGLDGRSTGREDERDGRRGQVGAVGKIDTTVHPNLPPDGGDEPEQI